MTTMTKPDWRKLELADSVLREPTPDDGQLILWLCGDLIDGFQHWERIGNVVGAEITLEQGLFRVPATVQGFLGKLRKRTWNMFAPLAKLGDRLPRSVHCCLKKIYRHARDRG